MTAPDISSGAFIIIIIFGKRITVNADRFYKIVQFIARKNQTGDLTPSEIGYAGSQAQNGYFDFLIGQLEQQQYGKPVPRVGVGMNAKVNTLLLPLKVTNALVTGIAGVYIKPANLNYLSLMTDTSFRKVSILDDTKFPARYNSKITPLTDTSSPFGRTTDTGWLIYPTSLTQIYVSYYFRPPDIVWNYTIGSNGRSVYNPTGSVAPSFDDVGMVKVVADTCKIMGISFKEEFLIEYGKEVQTAGR